MVVFSKVILSESKPTMGLDGEQLLADSDVQHTTKDPQLLMHWAVLFQRLRQRS